MLEAFFLDIYKSKLFLVRRIQHSITKPTSVNNKPSAVFSYADTNCHPFHVKWSVNETCAYNKRYFVMIYTYLSGVCHIFLNNLVAQV